MKARALEYVIAIRQPQLRAVARPAQMGAEPRAALAAWLWVECLSDDPAPGLGWLPDSFEASVGPLQLESKEYGSLKFVA